LAFFGIFAIYLTCEISWQRHSGFGNCWFSSGENLLYPNESRRCLAWLWDGLQK